MWCRIEDGTLINLNRYNTVFITRVSDDKFRVYASKEDTEVCIFTGNSLEQAQQFVDDLVHPSIEDSEGRPKGVPTCQNLGKAAVDH